MTSKSTKTKQGSSPSKPVKGAAKKTATPQRPKLVAIEAFKKLVAQGRKSGSVSLAGFPRCMYSARCLCQTGRPSVQSRPLLSGN